MDRKPLLLWLAEQASLLLSALDVATPADVIRRLLNSFPRHCIYSDFWMLCLLFFFLCFMCCLCR